MAKGRRHIADVGPAIENRADEKHKRKSSQCHNRRLRVFDCFAGDGRYVNERGEPLPASPQLAISITSNIVDNSSRLAVAFGFIEQNPSKAERLRIDLDALDCPASITRSVFAGDADVVTRSILKSLRSKPGTVPTFFFVDPYGHPLPIPLLRELIAIP
jgi:three-Cys-motif partner protein